MKYGVLTFSYNNFQGFRKRFERNGFYSINLGDFMQTLAARNMYRRIGIPDEDVVAIDRDSIATYEGEKVTLLMNACFYEYCFPLPANIIPIFIGFETKEPIVRKFADFFKQHEPIGCRDVATTQLFKRYDIAAFTTGCLTMTFDPRPSPPKNRRVLIVYGSGAGDLPAEILRYFPTELLECTDFIFQRKLAHSFPLSSTDMANSETHARHLLSEFRSRASLVVTPLHHAATPCIASGIPVVLCRKQDDSRFSYLREFMPVYLPETFSQIRWDVAPIDIAPIRTALTDRVKNALETVGQRAPYIRSPFRSFLPRSWRWTKRSGTFN